MACRSLNITCPLTRSIKGSATSNKTVKCFAIQESSISTATTETKETKPVTKAAAPAAAAGAKPKVAPKAPVKPLPQLIEEDVIPPLKDIFEAQDDLSEIQLFFQDNRLEGSFMKDATRYTFWAFFPDGNITGPKGFSLSSYGSEVSTVEPFLIDERKVTGKMVVFWVEKRLAAQGILPVWKE